jgi:hypothetical protein
MPSKGEKSDWELYALLDSCHHRTLTKQLKLRLVDRTKDVPRSSFSIILLKRCHYTIVFVPFKFIVYDCVGVAATCRLQSPPGRHISIAS